MPRPTNALIVDDEPHVRVFLRLLLQQLGIAAPWEAADGATALKLAIEHRPDLILLDINLPVMGGLEVLAAIKRNDPDVPVVVVTSQSAMKTVQDSARLGAAGYILKHTPKEEAVETLREIIDGLADDGDDGGSDAEPGPGSA
jgi:two-component system, chemotaxis family, chemotaxis protein CheY